MNTLIVGSIIAVAVMIAFLDYCCVASKRDRKQDDQEQLLWIEEHCGFKTANGGLFCV